VNQKNHSVASHWKKIIGGACALVILVGISQCFVLRIYKKQREKVSDHLVEDLVAGEEWISAMGGFLNAFARNLEVIPADAGSFLNSKETNYVFTRLRDEDLAGVSSIRFKFLQSGSDKAEEVVSGKLWGFLEKKRLNVDEGKFGFLTGSFDDSSRKSFRARVSFTAKGVSQEGGIAELKTVQEVSWALKADGRPPEKENDYVVEPKDWEVSEWTMVSAEWKEAPKPLFKEVTDRVIPDPEDYQLARTSRHVELTKNLFQGNQIPLKKGYGKYFTTDATSQHPALSVVDVNGDGFDDLYVCVRWGKNLLYRNKGNGTFEEVASEYGLDFDGVSAAAIFADFDNDGDPDLLLGRTLERSLYLVNEGGRFVDRSESHVAVSLPFLTTSVSAADYNGDGLLDLYLSTYGFAQRQGREGVARDFLSEYPREKVGERYVLATDDEPYLNLPGPPNLLLVNTGGGKFEKSPFSEQVETWHETLQATWGDYDHDGDPDLYVCNDFAPDQLYRNDGAKGFRDVTEENGHARMMGFGMGASFGDYDNDEDLDLYVSNMYSKAGLRITSKAGTRDERFRWSAEGNLLFQNKGTGFELMSELGSPLDVVAKADWSWGGQFLDVDNNGFLDLYVPNGYFTAPEAFAADEDL